MTLGFRGSRISGSTLPYINQEPNRPNSKGPYSLGPFCVFMKIVEGLAFSIGG